MRSNINVNSRPRCMTNPIGVDGYPLKCKICESIFHFAKNCPDSYENLERKTEEAIMFTGNKMEEIQTLLNESMNAAILDSACSSTVAGKIWMKCYLDTLSEEKQQQVTRCEIETIFKFGGGTRMKSIEKVTFPCEIAGVKCRITSDVVDSDIPLLLSKPSMKAAKVTLDFENDKASILGQNIDLQCTSSGHYFVPLNELPNVKSFEVLFNSI